MEHIAIWEFSNSFSRRRLTFIGGACWHAIKASVIQVREPRETKAWLVFWRYHRDVEEQADRDWGMRVELRFSGVKDRREGEKLYNLGVPLIVGTWVYRALFGGALAPCICIA